MTATDEIGTPVPIEFNEERHEYRVNGRIIPSVTQVLEVVGISDFSVVPANILDHAKDRGTAVHRACWYDDQGDLDEASLDPEVTPYVSAWRRFRTETGFEPQEIEDQFYCPEFAYCGTFDRVGTMPRWGLVQPDIKTGVESPSWPIQLAAYNRGRFGRLNPGCRRLVVQLTRDGRYKLHWYEVGSLTADFNVFAAALQIYNFRKRVGL